jgi:hypothetical protein
MSAFKTITSDKIIVSSNLTFPNRATINNMPTGVPNQFLQTNGSGIPIYGPGGGGQAPGSNEQSLWTIGGVTSWQNRSYRYGLNFTLPTTGQDWNTNPQLNITFGTVSSQSTSFGPNVYSPITVQTPGSILSINTSGTYKITILACLTNTGLITSKCRFNLVVNGFITLNPGIPVTVLPGAEECLSGSFAVILTAGQTISFTSTRESGTSPLICDGLNSRILIELIQTLI